MKKPCSVKKESDLDGLDILAGNSPLRYAWISAVPPDQLRTV